jgi:predicted ATPase
MNINSDETFFDKIDITKEKEYPIFLTNLEFEPFRHISKLNLTFKTPITVISGTNRSGKSTILMALACSHFDFKKRNPKNGKLERHTWSSLMKITTHDIQKEDWTYYITYKTGKKTERKRGQRKKDTKKWNGIGKKET